MIFKIFNLCGGGSKFFQNQKNLGFDIFLPKRNTVPSRNDNFSKNKLFLEQSRKSRIFMIFQIFDLRGGGSKIFQNQKNFGFGVFYLK